MKLFRWNHDKNEVLKIERGISFEVITLAIDTFEREILDAYERGELKFTSPSKAKLAKFKAAATATFLKADALTGTWQFVRA